MSSSASGRTAITPAAAAFRWAPASRSERIRTYNFPQGRVTDHRIGLTLYKIDEIMEGDLDEIIDALILAEQTALIEQQGEGAFENS